jgi:hypothetical protein
VRGGEVAEALTQFGAVKAAVRKPDESRLMKLFRPPLELGLAQAQRAAGRPGEALATLDGVISDLEILQAERPTGRMQRKLARARAERAAALVATRGARRDIARAASTAAALLRIEQGDPDEIAALERLATDQ